MKRRLLQIIPLALFVLASSNLKAQYWRLTGNAGTDSNTNFLGTTDKQPVIFRTNGKERMRIQNTGYVGIGTKKPAGLFNVVGGDYVGLASGGYAILGNVTGDNMALDVNVIQARYNGAAASLYLNYYGGYTYIGPSGSGVQVASNGNVGIKGSSNASYALNVNANSTISGIQVTDPVDNYVLYSAKSGAGSGIYVTKSSTSTGTASIEGNASGSGIGVEGSANTSYGVYGYSSTHEGVYGFTGGGGSIAGVHGYCASTGYGVWGEGKSGSGVYGTTSGTYAGYFVGNVYSTGTYQGSDLKLKQNIKDVTNAMDLINQLHPKLYNFRNDGNYKLMHLPEGIHYGLIAQDVEKILPNIVKDTKFETENAQPNAALVQPSNKGKENGSTSTQSSAKAKSETIDFKAVNYTELIPIMIKGMQEQQSVIEKQQQQIDQLQQLVSKLADANSSSARASALNTGAYLQQNTPNPFSQNTVIRCNLPAGTSQAKLVVYTSDGKQLKSYSLNNSGMNEVSINAGTLSAGKYSYALIVDGKIVDSKSMVVAK